MLVEHSYVLGKPPRVPLGIVQDTREQAPLRFPVAYADVTVGTVKVGDYTLASDVWPIERKSVDDLIGSILSGTLETRLDRMRAAVGPGEPVVVVVDGDKDDFAASKVWMRTNRATCAWGFSELYRLQYQYQAIVDWNPSRRWAAMSVWRWLRTRYKQIVGKKPEEWCLI